MERTIPPYFGIPTNRIDCRRWLRAYRKYGKHAIDAGVGPEVHAAMVEYINVLQYKHNFELID